ncbi:hypothetical protein ACWGN9_19720 [Streptomyces sp. NPDC055775]
MLAPGDRFPAVARLGILLAPAGKVLPDGTYLSELRGRGTSERMPVRGIEYTTTLGPDSAVEETSEVFCLIATLLDPVHAPAGELAELYAARWTSEAIYKNIKIEQRGRHTATLRSNSLVLGEHQLMGHALRLPGPAPSDRRHRQPRGPARDAYQLQTRPRRRPTHRRDGLFPSETGRQAR